MRRILVMTIFVLLLPLSAFAQTAVSVSGASADARSLAIAGEGGDVWATMGISLQQTFEAAHIPRSTPEIPPLIPFPLGLLQGGKIGDVSIAVVKSENGKSIPFIPNFADVGLTPLTTEKIMDVRVFNGSIFDRVRLEDIERDLVKYYRKVYTEEGWDPKRIRFRVQYKDSAVSAGVGGGGMGSFSHLGGMANATGAAAAILPGFQRSTADPAYVIKFYLVEA